MIVIDAKRNAVTCIGRLGENEARVIRINVSQIMRAFPGAAFTVLHRRPGDMDAYPVNGAYIAMDGENVLWTVASGDVEKEGVGQFEVVASVDGTIVKTVVYNSRVDHALDGAGDPPEPWESWVTDVTDAADRAEAAAQLLEHPGAEAETLAPGSSATAGYADGTFTFGIPQGEKGDTGEQGPEGPEGPAGQDGRDGQDGAPGADGFSPTASVSKSGKVATITITDKNGTTTAQVSDGADGTDIIDDTAGAGDTDKTWSASKSAGEVGSLKSQIGAVEESIAPVETSTTATAAHAVGELFMLGDSLLVALLAIAVGDTIATTGATPNAAVTSMSAKMIKDVQVNGVSVLNQGVANVPTMSANNYGVARLGDGSGSYGLIVNDGTLMVNGADDYAIKTGSGKRKPVTSENQHKSTFYGLAKAAGADQSASSVTVGNYTDAAKVAIQKMLGIYEAPWELIREDTVTNATEANVEITVDGDGNAFELTDIRILVFFPEQETQASITNSGKVTCYIDNSAKSSFYFGNKTQAASGSSNCAIGEIEQQKGMLSVRFTSFSTNASYMQARTQSVLNAEGSPYRTSNDIITYKKIVITNITGTVSYKLYGKRKWN